MAVYDWPKSEVSIYKEIKDRFESTYDVLGLRVFICNVINLTFTIFILYDNL